MKKRRSEDESSRPAAPPSVDEVAERLKVWFPDLEASTVARLTDLFAHLVRFTKAINLVSAHTLRSADSVHLADSILASRLIAADMKKPARLYDLGSGNGFPGLVFSILYPEREVVLVDQDARKSEYLRICVADLKLSMTQVEQINVSLLPDDHIEYAMARGFAPLSKSLLLMRRHFKKGGRFYHLKGDGFPGELAQVPSQALTVWSPEILASYRLPDSVTDLSVVVTTKIVDQ